ncbi:MAG: ATP-binding cassette domain-containing protein [Sedimenticolaceae bacterium]
MSEQVQTAPEQDVEGSPAAHTAKVEVASLCESQLTPVLAVKNLSFAWPASAFQIGITDLNVKSGEHWMLEGPSGSGKSTLLQLLGGVLLPQRGEVRILGQSWAALSAAQRDLRRADHVGFIFQQFNLVPYLSVIDNVLLPCQFSTRRRKEAESGGTLVDEARRLLAALGLGARDVQLRRAARLSVGQQQRVAAARALIGRPSLVLADEPTSALDADNRDSFLEVLFSEARSANTAIVLVSHDTSLRPHFERYLMLEGD